MTPNPCRRCGKPVPPHPTDHRPRQLCSRACHSRPTAERFWSKVQRGDGCWPWQGSKNHRGYGSFRGAHRKTTAAHRVAYTLTHGPIPKGLHVMHSCDNRACVNPAHLSLGTPLDNTRDMMRKGRQRPPRGELARKGKLTDQTALFARALWESGSVTQAEIARRLGVDSATICHVVTRRTWRHI